MWSRSCQCGHDSSNGVPSVAKAIIEARSLDWKIAQSLLYDTLIQGFWSGYFGGTNEEASFSKELHESSIVLIELAIIVMGDFVA